MNYFLYGLQNNHNPHQPRYAMDVSYISVSCTPALIDISSRNDGQETTGALRMCTLIDNYSFENCVALYLYHSNNLIIAWK